jgi:hypothetical protein
VDQLNVLRKDVLQAEAIDGMRVSATDFHHAVVAFRTREAPNLFSRFRDQFGLSKLVNKSHANHFLELKTGSIYIFQAVPLNFLHSSVDLSQHSKCGHLVGGILLADLAHGETHMDEHPVAWRRLVVLQEPEINLASHSDYIYQRGILIVG